MDQGRRIELCVALHEQLRRRPVLSHVAVVDQYVEVVLTLASDGVDGRHRRRLLHHVHLADGLSEDAALVPVLPAVDQVDVVKIEWGAERVDAGLFPIEVGRQIVAHADEEVGLAAQLAGDLGGAGCSASDWGGAAAAARRFRGLTGGACTGLALVLLLIAAAEH
jgi:hypothetical protein